MDITYRPLTRVAPVLMRLIWCPREVHPKTAVIDLARTLYRHTEILGLCLGAAPG